MKFADFHAGQVIEVGSYTLDEDEMLRFAKTYDPQWFHVDPKTAAEGRYGGLIASGWQTCAIGMRLAVDNVLMGSETVGSPGVAYIKWPNPVRPGDSLTLRAEVLETRRSKSQPDLGIMRWRWRLFNQHGQEVLESEATSLFDLSPKLEMHENA
ncbi:MAG TPA: MaoC family dehydratase [Roseiarcus sp.]|nr:MaoC family dehydratase [Roseiarcus sp.]